LARCFHVTLHCSPPRLPPPRFDVDVKQLRAFDFDVTFLRKKQPHRAWTNRRFFVLFRRIYYFYFVHFPLVVRLSSLTQYIIMYLYAGRNKYIILVSGTYVYGVIHQAVYKNSDFLKFQIYLKTKLLFSNSWDYLYNFHTKIRPFYCTFLGDHFFENFRMGSLTVNKTFILRII